jgi:hypothetical protein
MAGIATATRAGKIREAGHMGTDNAHARVDAAQ